MTIDKPQKSSEAALRQLWKQAFGDSDAFLDSFFHRGFSPDRCRCLTRSGQLCAALYWFDCLWQGKKIAYLYAVATDKALQGKGSCRALMEDTHRHLKELGYAGAALVPGNEGLFRLYEKLGYRPFCPVDEITVIPGGVPAPIRPITADTYAKLRLGYVPESSVIQEGAALSFLATFVDFYTGGDTLFCVARETDVLYFQEFLGDPAKLPGILTALHAAKGYARVPGKDKPFAMYRSLTEDPYTPAYLGIALN